MKHPMTWAEVYLSSIKHNLKEVRKLALRNAFILSSRSQYQKVQILAVIKADAYGHGMQEVGIFLEDQGVKHFAVSDISEGICMRRAGLKSSILLLENSLPEYISEIISNDLTPTVSTLEFAAALNDELMKRDKKTYVQLEVDTGMGRLGIWHEDMFDFVRQIMAFSHLVVNGLYTHFPVADTDRSFTEKQIKILEALVNRLDQKGWVIPYIHAANSMGLLGYSTTILNLVRPGLMLYGLLPCGYQDKSVSLQPALSVKSRIIYIKKVGKGQSVSYGRTFIAEKELTVATIPIGYNDGYPVRLSSKAFVLVQGMRCPILGRVTMDQVMIDVSNVSGVELGGTVTILGEENDGHVKADELAQWAGTINYEIICGFGNRLPRSYSQ